MRKLWIVGIGLVLSGIIAPITWAEQTTTLNKVVVTASRQEESMSRVPAHVTVVTAEQIEQSTSQNVADVLSTLVGAHVMDTGGNRRNYWVDLRGSGESSPQNLLMLVDGRRVNLGDLSGADWNLIPIERIARIEVVRGSRGTILYGDNASKGVINIITKEGGGFDSNVRAAYGSYETFKVNGVVSNAHEKLSYDISAGYVDSEGFRDNSKTDTKDIGANVRFDPSDQMRLHVSAGYHFDDTRTPGAILESQFANGAKRKASFFPDDFAEVDDYYVKAGLEVDMLSNDMFKLEASSRWRDKDAFGSSGAYWFRANTETKILTLSPQLIFREDFGGISNRITLGGDYTHSSQDYDNYSEFFGAPSQIVATLKKENYAYYLHDDLTVGKNFSISMGYRFDRATYEYEPVTSDSKRTFDEEAYNVGINYLLAPGSHLFASYTRGFRYPVLDEQFYYFNSTLDTSLNPQKSDDYEVGASATVTPNLNLSLTFFRSETKDEIFFNFIDAENQNLDSTVIRQGAELAVGWRYKSLTINGRYSRTDIDIDGNQFSGNTFPFVPEDKASATARLQFSCGLSLGLEAIYIGDRFLIGDWDNDPRYGKADEYTVVNAKMAYQWRRLTFFADLNNIFDEEYAVYSALGYNSSFDVEPGEYPAPEFNVLVGVTARFGAN